ncbi:MAG: four helix bundle protein [Cyclobacteriaceae bacterium]|nr:four helix bundle protein [Cyclobacteriaceae bacterium]
MYIFAFEKLEVWQRSNELIKEIYRITESFPSEEKFGMVSQLRRASVSVSNNLAEGTARKTAKDQANFTTMSFSSLMEVLNMMIISVALGFLKDAEYQKTRPLIEEIANKLNALRNSQNGR